MPTYRILIEYDGSGFHGWQVQPELITIQQVIEDALKILFKQDIRIIAAGRTDAGVHATGQVASFVTEIPFEPFKLCHALNALTPRKIAILDVKEGPEGFDARRWAIGREYKYRILNRRSPSAISRKYFLHHQYRLDFAAMNEAARYLVGQQDFSSFRGSGCCAKTPVRRIISADWLEIQPNLWEFTIYGTGFLKHMVRAIVGTLLTVGAGKQPHEWVGQVIAEKNRDAAGITAPAHGLTFSRVDYDENLPPLCPV